MKQCIAISMAILLWLGATSGFAQRFVTIGTGTGTSTSVFNINTVSATVKFSKSGTYITAAELRNAGAFVGTISQLSVMKTSAANYISGKNRIQLYYKLTNATDSGFGTVASGNVDWRIDTIGAIKIYDGPVIYSGPALSWQNFNLTTPITWDGVSNLRVFADFRRFDTLGTSVSLQTTTFAAVAGKGRTAFRSGNALDSIYTRGTIRANMRFKMNPSSVPSVAAINITAPVAGFVQVGSNPISVTIQNLGLAGLTSATINHSVNGVLGTPFTFNGNLDTFQVSQPVTIATRNMVAGTNTVEIWVSNPNGTPDVYLRDDTIRGTFDGCNFFSGNYSINPLQPVSATNYHTFNDFFTALRGCAMSGDIYLDFVKRIDTLSTGSIEIPLIQGAANFRLEILGNRNVVKYMNRRLPAVNRGSFFFLNGARNVKIKNLTIMLDSLLPTGTVTTPKSYMMHITNRAQDIEIDSCRFLHDSSNINTATGTTSPAVSISISSSATDISTTGNAAKNVTISNCYFSGGSHGIGGAGTTFAAANPTGTMVGLNNIVIKNNVFRNQIFTSIRLSNLYGALIDGNHISRPTRGPLGTGASTSYGIHLPVSTDSVTVSNNVITRLYPRTNTTTATIYGINVGGDAVRVDKPLRIFNNSISRFTGRGLQAGVYMVSANNVHVINNTVALIDSTSPATATTMTYGIGQTTAATGVIVRNNNIYIHRPNPTNATTQSATKVGLGFLTNTSVINSNYNNVAIDTSTGQGTGLYGLFGTVAAGVRGRNLTQWRTVNNGTFDSNSVAVDPGYDFQNSWLPSNFTPRNADLNNKARLFQGVTTDITGAPRNLATPDIGAYEFTGGVICTSPTGLSTGTVLSNSVVITWSAIASGTIDLIYGPQGFNPQTSGTTLTGLTGTSEVVQGLTLSTTYDFYIKRVCGVGSQSNLIGPITVTTANDPFDEPCGARDVVLGTACSGRAMGSTASATTSSSNFYANVAAQRACGAATFRDVWFKFTIPAGGLPDPFLYVLPNGVPANMITIYRGTSCNGPLTNIACSIGSGASQVAPAFKVSRTLLNAGETYFMRVGTGFTGSTTGQFTVCLNTDSINISGISKVTEQGIIIKPNPNNGSFEITNSNLEDGSYQLSVLNTAGIEVKRLSVNLEAGRTQLNLNDLEQGLYRIMLSDGKRVFAKTFVKQ